MTTSLDRSIGWLTDLVRFNSVSSRSNADVSAQVASLLERLDFDVESTSYNDPLGVPKVNLVARRGPNRSHDSASSGLAYFCHTDVVPVLDWTGPADMDGLSDPFGVVVDDGRIYGRGVVDMKGSLVAMLTAAAAVPARVQTAPLWIVCTADEETGFHGARHVVEHSAAYRDIVSADPLAIIGEPTGMKVVYAHKGITGFRITATGKAAHSSTSDGVNANEAMVPMLIKLNEMARRTREDSRYHDDRFDPPHLSWTFGVSDGCTAINITPGRSTAWCSLRTMPGIDGEDLIAEAEETASSLGLTFSRYRGGQPVDGPADTPTLRKLLSITGGQPRTVCFGTDGGEFFELNHRVVLGPGHIEQAHTDDEFISIDDLRGGVKVYQEVVSDRCT